MNPLIHSAFTIMADKLLITYKNKIQQQKKELEGFHNAQKLNMIYLPSYYDKNCCVLCNTTIETNNEKYKDMVWKYSEECFIYNNDHSIEWNYDNMTDIYMCYNCAKNETCNKEVLDTWNYEINGRDYIDINNNRYCSLGICIIKNK